MQKIQTIILCGGRGYRLKEETEFKPKPMIEIGGKPILWHIMKIYSHYGFSNFIVALGYKGNQIKDYFVNKQYYDGDFTLDETKKKNNIKHYRRIERDNFKITFVDTGIESFTGERVRRLKNYLDGKYFMLTYGDGLSNINVRDLLKYHISKKALITVSGVKPLLKYGGFEVSADGWAKTFEKKAKLRQFINGGYMVFDRNILPLIKKDSMIEEVFQPVLQKKRLAIYMHGDFFQAMDTYQDMEDLNNDWSEKPAWKIWH